MRDRLLLSWTIVQGSLWFVPMLMGAAATAVAILLLNLDPGPVQGEGEFWLLYTGDAENARELMSALLSGMITMTSLVVSITMVVLTLAAGQIGPRLIRSFIQDRFTQGVLGLFLADILYLLVVFRTINGPPEGSGGGGGGIGGGSVPHLAVSTGTALTVVCLLVLLIYIHKLARSIIYDTVVRNVTCELQESIERLLPVEDADGPVDDVAIAEPTRPGVPVTLCGEGYVQAIGFDELVAAGRDGDILVRLRVAPGDFVLAGSVVATLHRAGTSPPDEGIVRDAFVVGSERTPTQDIGFGIRQLVEIASRALSPGLNDVFTAVVVIDNLSGAMAKIFQHRPQARCLRDDAGTIRVVRDVPGYDALVGDAFDQIRHSGGGNPMVLVRLAEAMARIGTVARSEEQRQSLRRQLEAVVAAGERNLGIPRDRDRLREACERAARSLDARAREIAEP